MLENIELKVDEIKEICKKNGLNMDHFWVEVNRHFNLKQVKNAGNREKRNGTPIEILFEIAVALPFFSSNSVRSFFNSQYKKMLNCNMFPFYRFCQDFLFDWRKVLYQLNGQIRRSDNTLEHTNKYPTALILDDTVIPKTGKRIEGVSKVHDHVAGRSVTGFKLLGLCWFNGFYSRFLDFSLVGEKKIKFKRSHPQFKKKRNADSPGHQRKRELKKDKITLACELICKAVKHRFIPEYVLTDTWFTCTKLINTVKSIANGKIHFLGMIKNGRRKYEYDGQLFTLSQLRKYVTHRVKRCSRFKSRYIVVDCVIPDIGEVRLFFSRFHGNKKWVALVSTELDMKYIKAIETYALRWNIEIGFKETKQLLGLGKHQANDFTSQIAHTTNVFIAHAILANCKYNEDHQSFGVLFKNIQEQYTTLLTMDKLLLALEYLLRSIGEHLGGIQNITVEELLKSQEYLLFKEMLKNSLSLDVNCVNYGLIFDNEGDVTEKPLIAS
jgi:hypothetical protein